MGMALLLVIAVIKIMVMIMMTGIHVYDSGYDDTGGNGSC